MQFRPEALLQGIGEESSRILPTLAEQNLANVRWILAKLAWREEPLFAAIISTLALIKMPEFFPQA